jgi:hypothetical protein
MKATPLLLVALAISAPATARQQGPAASEKPTMRSQVGKSASNAAVESKCRPVHEISAFSVEQEMDFVEAATEEQLDSLKMLARWCAEHGDRRTRMDAFDVSGSIIATQGARLATKERQAAEQETIEKMTKVMSEKMSEFAAAASKSQQALIRENNNLWDTYDKLYATYTETYRIAHSALDAAAESTRSTSARPTLVLQTIIAPAPSPRLHCTSRTYNFSLLNSSVTYMDCQ